MEQFASQISDLVRERQRRNISVEELAETQDIDVEILRAVERSGSGAALGHIRTYAEALGYDIGLVVVAEPRIQQRPHLKCEKCGESSTHHVQTHVDILDACIDTGLVQLVKALYSVGVRVLSGCQGFEDGRRGGEAHIVLPSLADARTFFAIVDRDRGQLAARAGLRGAHTLGGSWSSAVRWDVLPGELLADATCVVRFPATDLDTLSELANNPPKPALAATRRRRPN